MIGRHGDGAVLFKNVHIFDGTGVERFPGSLLVRGNRVAQVIAGSDEIDAPEAMVVDGRGGTLMPGMVEGTLISPGRRRSRRSSTPWISRSRSTCSLPR